ncbi:MAG: hypothetical protein FJ034_08325 [Chloroflexi bacterium]|nr:hypothetical protein [Chloroflexota bacterium]
MLLAAPCRPVLLATLFAATACGEDGGGPRAAASDAGSSDGGSVGEGDGGPAAACPFTASAAPGDTQVSIESGGVARQFYVHVPARYTGDRAVPLVVDLHPFLNFATGDAADIQRKASGWLELADSEGFIVVHPIGIDRAWNLGTCCTESREVDDVGFVLAVVERLKQTACIDPKRVYATGYSNGGGLSYLLACRAADVFAAVAPASFDLVEEILPCTPSRPIAQISFRGVSDPVVPFAGGNPPPPPSSYPLDPLHFLGAEGTFARWAEIDGCTDAAAEAPGTADWKCRAHSSCAAGTTATLCSGETATSSGHVQGNAALAWDVLSRHPMP